MQLIVGQKISNFTVLGLKENGKTRKSYLVECVCGKKMVISRRHLEGSETRRPTQSCGCLQKAHNGLTQTQPRLYGIWNLMKKRCANKDLHNYKNYGGKGIFVCDEWLNDFTAFVNWSLKNGYADNLSIDRIDPGKPYEPSNCRWATNHEQATNKGMNSRNTTGYTGVFKDKNGFRAIITRFGKEYYLGKFEKFEDARSERERAEKYFEVNGSFEGYDYRRLRKRSKNTD